MPKLTPKRKAGLALEVYQCWAALCSCVGTPSGCDLPHEDVNGGASSIGVVQGQSESVVTQYQACQANIWAQHLSACS